MFERFHSLIFHSANIYLEERKVLPENLRFMFRPCAMLQPDWSVISQMILYSNGFDDSHLLARKLIELHQVCAVQFSHRHHYDFSGRTIKVILAESRRSMHRKPSLSPIECIGKTIRAIHLPRIVDEDIPMFKSICERLFPSTEPSTFGGDSSPLKRRIRHVLEKLSLQSNAYIVDKISDAYDMLAIRNGVMIVGETMSGKTTVWQTLAETLKDLRAHPIDGMAECEVFSRVINPKAITSGQLFGEVDATSGDWCDGVLGKTFREMVSMAISAKTRSWIVLDGPVDVSWIECMHTLLDGNRKLSLASGEMIEHMPLMSILFETEHLAHASPTTVARCGIVHMNLSRLGWRILHTKLVAELRATNGMNDAYVTLYEALVDWLIPGLLFILAECQMVLNVTEMQQYNVRRTLISFRFSSR